MAEQTIFIGAGEHPVQMLARYGNRHGLIAGATGTGKTVTLKVLVEGFSKLGVPVFVADMKGVWPASPWPASWATSSRAAWRSSS